jgi:hypothetical protein
MALVRMYYVVQHVLMYIVAHAVNRQVRKVYGAFTKQQCRYRSIAKR